jgi:transposase
MFYERVNQILATRRFDDFVESECRRFYHERLGWPSLPPGVYFRCLLIGYFEGLDSEPARAADRRVVRCGVREGVAQEAPYPQRVLRTHDPDAKVTKMKDGGTHLAHKAEHAVDLDTGAIVAVTIQPADRGDTTSMAETITVAADNLVGVIASGAGENKISDAVVSELVADKRYHSNGAG